MSTGATNQQWSPDELQQIAGADDLKISPLREDGLTYGTPTWIWHVALDGELYVRAYHGQKSRWYQSALQQKAGRIHAAGLIKDVLFEPVEGGLHDWIDEAYRAKYKTSSYLRSMLSDRAKAATVRILPLKKR